MTIDYLEFDTVPSSEPCVQIGDENYRYLAVLEADVLIDQLKRMYPQAYPLGISFKRTYNNHDFGQYVGIKVIFNEDIPDHELVYDIDKNFPEHWDEISVSRLWQSKEYSHIMQQREREKNHGVEYTDRIAFNQLARGY